MPQSTILLLAEIYVDEIKYSKMAEKMVLQKIYYKTWLNFYE